ncbi:MAG: class I fructose-bisphosphate aldolase [Patescibacteria group bacterium]
MNYSQITELLGEQAKNLLEFKNPKISKDRLSKPSPNFLDEVFSNSDRSQKTQDNLKLLFNSGRLSGTGYVSILPVDQGIEHTAGASFAPNPDYFDPENIVKLAIEGGTNAVASTLGVLGMMSKKYADKIPFIVKINHNELMTYPNKHDQIFYSDAQTAYDMGAVGIGATVYFGSKESNRQISRVAAAFRQAHELGMFTVLWCYTRNLAFKTEKQDYHTAADLTGQANYLGATIEADIIKQKSPVGNFAFRDLKFGKESEQMYDLVGEHPIDLTRWQVANCFMGRVGLINSGGASGENDLQQAVATAVINKRAGGMGLISGRKAFQKPLKDGVEILNAIQDVYLEKEITIA